MSPRRIAWRRGVGRGALVALVVALAGCSARTAFHAGYLRACPATGPVARKHADHQLVPFDLAEHYARIRRLPAAAGRSASAGDRGAAGTGDRSAAVRRPSTVEVARVRHGGTTYPIHLIECPGDARSRRALVVAGVHGDEASGVLAATALAEELATRPDAYPGWHLWVLPALNPVGLAHGSRFNGQGCDVNRDFAAFRTAEARTLRAVVRDVAPDVILSFKEGPQDGFMVIVTRSGEPRVGRAIAAAVADAGIRLARWSYLGLPLSSPGVWIEGWWLTLLKGAVGMKTLGRYARARGIATYTTEVDWKSRDLEARGRAHRVALRAALAAARR